MSEWIATGNPVFVNSRVVQKCSSEELGSSICYDWLIQLSACQKTVFVCFVNDKPHGIGGGRGAGIPWCVPSFPGFLGLLFCFTLNTLHSWFSASSSFLVLVSLKANILTFQLVLVYICFYDIYDILVAQASLKILASLLWILSRYCNFHNRAFSVSLTETYRSCQGVHHTYIKLS